MSTLDITACIYPTLLLVSIIVFELIGYGFVMRAIGCIPLAGIILYVTREGFRFVDSMIHWSSIVKLGENQNIFTHGLLLVKEVSGLNCGKQLGGEMNSTTIMFLALSITVMYGVSSVMTALWRLQSILRDCQRETLKSQ